MLCRDRGLELVLGADNTEVADVTTLGWLDRLDVFYKPLIGEIEQLRALLLCFLDAEKLLDVTAYILACFRASSPVCPDNAPKAPGREGKMTKAQQAALLI